MPVTTLDPKTALIVIDLQKGIVAMPLAHPIKDVVTRACSLADMFRRLHLPVVLVNVAGHAPGRIDRAHSITSRPADWSDLIPELNQQPDDLTVTKQRWGALVHTGLEDQLKTLGVTQVVIAGVATSIGVESTARQAFEAGFNVTLATDAMTDMSLDGHNNSVVHTFPSIGETGFTQEILDLLGKRSA